MGGSVGNAGGFGYGNGLARKPGKRRLKETAHKMATGSSCDPPQAKSTVLHDPAIDAVGPLNPNGLRGEAIENLRQDFQTSLETKVLGKYSQGHPKDVQKQG